jgi:hypothetical protein
MQGIFRPGKDFVQAGNRVEIPKSVGVQGNFAGKLI